MGGLERSGKRAENGDEGMGGLERREERGGRGQVGYQRRGAIAVVLEGAYRHLGGASDESEVEHAGPRSGRRMKGTMKEEKQKCVSCGENSMRKGEITLTREVGEHVFSATVTGLICGACGETIADVEAGERFDLAVAEILSEALPTADSFRFLRRVIGLRARDLARMLGITGDTISRWENGKHAIDRAAFFVLGKVVREKQSGSTAMLDLLVRGEMPRALPRVVNVHLE